MRCWGAVILSVTCLAISAGAQAADCDANDPTLLKPDLIAEPPTHVRVLSRLGHRVVIFSTTIGNVGKGPMILQGQTVDDPNGGGQVTQATQKIMRTDGSSCDHLAGFFEFHPSHHHWHFDDFADYELRKDDPYTGAVVAKAEKVSFCLIDVARIRGYHTPITIAANCLVQDGTQGIDVGYADVYDSFLPGQLIDLDADPANPIPAGNYFLVNTVNPAKAIWEINDDAVANSGVVSVRIPPAPGQNSSAPRHPPHSPRPPLPLPSSHQLHNTPRQPHDHTPSFPQPGH